MWSNFQQVEITQEKHDIRDDMAIISPAENLLHVDDDNRH